MSARILIVDDHGVLRAGLRALLNAEADMDVVGEAGDGQSAIRLSRHLQPDVILMDIGLPDQGGIEVARQIIDQMPGVRVLILTMYEDRALLQEAIRVGASGYFPKRAVETELVSAVRAVMRGDLYVHPVMTRALLSEQVVTPAERPASGSVLTPRETEVLGLLAIGHTNREVALLLMVSIRTVESHRANLMGKLNLHSRVELVRYAAQHGLLQPPDK